jgi:hypothetical protein
MKYVQLNPTWTVDPLTEDGIPRFLPDVYDRDDRIFTALEAPFRFVPPDDIPTWIEEQNSPGLIQVPAA